MSKSKDVTSVDTAGEKDTPAVDELATAGTLQESVDLESPTASLDDSLQDILKDGQVIEELKKKIKFASLRNDHAFKAIFGRHGNEDLLLKLLDCIIPEYHIKSLTLGPQENVGDRPESRKTIYDIRCTSQDGRTFEVEMQVKDKDDFNDRMLYYSTFPVREGLKKGDKGYKMKPVILVSILNFCLDEESTTGSCVNKFQMNNVDRCDKPLTDKLTFVVLELPKFVKKLKELNGNSEKMFWLLRHLETCKKKPAEFEGEYFAKLFEVSNFAAMDRNDQEEYIRMHWLDELDHQSELNTALRKALEVELPKQEARLEAKLRAEMEAKLKAEMEAKLRAEMEAKLKAEMEAKLKAEMEAKLKAEMEAKCIAEGKAEGKAEGRAEEKLANAKSMKENGTAPEFIAKCLGLTIEQVTEL